MKQARLDKWGLAMRQMEQIRMKVEMEKQLTLFETRCEK